jgi:CheY-like chemotaxis protein
MRLPPRPRLLIVDDSIVVRRVLALTVRQIPELMAAEIEEAGNGAIALKKLAQDSYDLVLSDIRMPLLDGFELVRIARREMGLTIPIVLISTLGREEDVKRGMEAGATAYILKPLSPHHIKLALRELVDAPDPEPGGNTAPAAPVD